MAVPKVEEFCLLDANLSVAALTKLADDLIAKQAAVFDSVAAIPADQRTFENTVMAIHDIEAEVGTLSSNSTFPLYVSTDKSVREASAAANEKLEQAQVDFYSRPDVYKALCEVEALKLPLDPLQKRLLDKLKVEFERNGMHLTGEKKERFVAVKKRLSELTTKFQANINEDKTEVLFTRDELDGLPDDFLAALARRDDRYAVSLKYPELLPTMRYARREQTRQAMDRANGTRCLAVNAPLLEEAVALRHELAQLMGCRTFAEFELQEKMAKTPAAVTRFLSELAQRLRPKAEKELAALAELKREEAAAAGRDTDGVIRAWDTQYYLRMHTERCYNVDDNAVKPYFPMEHVTDALLELYQSILGLRFCEIDPAESRAWHPDVRMFGVADAATGEFMGAFYLDLYPRDGKYTHAAAFPLQPTCVLRGRRQLPVSAMVANFTKPAADRPSLLKHDEVVTYFHEFGHVMHGVCSRSPYARFAGTSVERDFVEAPSQMKENWAWERDVLRRISRHYKTGEPLPDALIDNMLAAKNAHSGLLNLRQIFFATFDMTIHSLPAVDTAALWARLRPEISLVPETPGNNPAASFGHLMGGYEAGYYGYLWSQVFSADMYTRFKKEGITSPDVGRQYRDKILARGRTMDGLDMVRDFLGREPTQDAFLESIGAA